MNPQDESLKIQERDKAIRENLLVVRNFEAVEVLRIDPDGRIFWKQREVETDDDMRPAMLELKTALIKHFDQAEVVANLRAENHSLREQLKQLEEQKPVGVYRVTYYKGIPAMGNAEFQPMTDFTEGTHNLYAAAGAKP